MWNITWVTCTYTHLWTVLLPGAPPRSVITGQEVEAWPLTGGDGSSPEELWPYNQVIQLLYSRRKPHSTLAFLAAEQNLLRSVDSRGWTSFIPPAWVWSQPSARQVSVSFMLFSFTLHSHNHENDGLEQKLSSEPPHTETHYIWAKCNTQSSVPRWEILENALDDWYQSSQRAAGGSPSCEHKHNVSETGDFLQLWI